MNYTKITLGELLSSANETIKRNAVSILKIFQKKHKLKIISLYDANAECGCGWYYSFTGERTQKQIEEEYYKHI